MVQTLGSAHEDLDVVLLWAWNILTKHISNDQASRLLPTWFCIIKGVCNVGSIQKLVFQVVPFLFQKNVRY